MQNPDFSKPHYLIDTFTQHRLASNLLMIMLVLAGFWGLRQLTVQLNPAQDSTQAVVSIAWPGASAEDVERLVTQPVEYQLRSLSRVGSLTSNTSDSLSEITVRFDKGTDMIDAMDRVKQRLSQVRDLPVDIEPPMVLRGEELDTIAAILISSKGTLDELVPVAREIERDLLARGIDTVEFRGVPDEEIAIQIDSRTLFELGVPLSAIAASVLSSSTDVPAGDAGGGQLERKLRSLDQRRSAQDFAEMPLRSSDNTELVRLGDIADIERRQRDEQRLVYYDDDPAIMIRLRRGPDSDTLDAADILYAWKADNAASLEERGIKVTVWLEAWRFALDQISLVFRNGVGGLLLVIATLFLFLNGRVAWWVTLGIPVSFLGALAVFHAFGGSINFISMIGVVMGLGIVVDDAIVVGEHSLTQFEAGHSPEVAAAQGAQRMFAPVMASSLTTLAAFLPLLVIDEPFIREIPLLMVCVIIASLVECFLVMPGHLRHSFTHMQRQTPSRWRAGFDARFDYFRQHIYLPALHRALANRRTVLTAALLGFVIALTLLISGRVKPTLDVNVHFEFADAYMQFAAGTSEEQIQDWLETLATTAQEADVALGGGLVVTRVINRNYAFLDEQVKTGSQYAAMWVELVSPEKRAVTLDEFIAAWQQRLPPSPLVERLRIGSGDGSWPELGLYLSGADVETLKQAAEDLAARIATYPGVTDVFDDLPYGKEQWIVELTTEGRSLGLTGADIGRQLRSAFEGYRVQLFTENDAELEVRVSLPASERDRLDTLYQLPVTTPAGESVPLVAVATISNRRGIERINHRDARKSVNVYAHIDEKLNTAMAIITALEQDVIPEITRKYNVSYGLGESSAEEAQTMADMMLGAVIGLLLIYLILAWVFASWSWPLAVMTAIPLGLTGALGGLYLLDLNLGALAIMGVFTLTGVIVNDSIILVTAYREARERGMDTHEALETACGLRLRPVILTSLTTTLGLGPLMLEGSPMGEAMVPLAVVICFGLMYGTALILFVIPTILSVLEQLAARQPAGVQYEIQAEIQTTH
ncbi:MAG: efflux RND transporter permease subunit [Pseudomonadales bacterium]|nr:efflux RND transporter permease subunit [Pseudomonadales bacterium]